MDSPLSIRLAFSSSSHHCPRDYQQRQCDPNVVHDVSNVNITAPSRICSHHPKIKHLRFNHGTPLPLLRPLQQCWRPLQTTTPALLFLHFLYLLVSQFYCLCKIENLLFDVQLSIYYF